MKYAFMTLAALLMMVACSDKNEDLPQPMEQEIELSPEEAACLMRYHLKEEYATTPRSELAQRKALEAISTLDKDKSTRSNSARKVKSIDPIVKQTLGGTLKTAYLDTTALIVNFESNQGFVILSNDWRTDQVLAIVENGNLDINDKESYPPQMEIFFSNMQVMLEQQKAEADTKDTEYLEDVLSKFHKNRQEGGLKAAGDIHTQFMYYEDPIIVSSGKLTKTRWGQNEPFNNDAPLINGQHAVAGCVATAIAQVMAYHKFPREYNWDKFVTIEGGDNDYNGQPSLASLFRLIGDNVSMNWGLKGSSAYTKDAVSHFRKMGYKNPGEYAPYYYGRVENSINDFGPILTRGTNKYTNEGHSWIIDGYRKSSTIAHYLVWEEGVGVREFYTKTEYRDAHVHCNWGWNGIKNGYFAEGAFVLRDEADYTNINCVYNIKP